MFLRHGNREVQMHTNEGGFFVLDKNLFGEVDHRSFKVGQEGGGHHFEDPLCVREHRHRSEDCGSLVAT